MNVVFAIATGIMFGLGVFQLLRRDLIKMAMGFYILFTAINFFFLAVGVYDGNVAPKDDGIAPLYLENGVVVARNIGTEENPVFARPSDPLVQALLLTAIVISFGSFALLVGMINVASVRFKTLDSDHVNHLQA
ncbi:MAG TPA: sodium:proton antiporter [Aggregatilineales bacterium]|nr:sodium:proton antiporter [Aggregatilineales bacterium]